MNTQHTNKGTKVFSTSQRLRKKLSTDDRIKRLYAELYGRENVRECIKMLQIKIAMRSIPLTNN